jgi:hypothetical protein
VKATGKTSDSTLRRIEVDIQLNDHACRQSAEQPHPADGAHGAPRLIRVVRGHRPGNADAVRKRKQQVTPR